MQKAFTLIELIIVIAIITIMAVLAVPAFDSYGARNDLDNKAEEIKLAIETAYNQAQSPVKGSNGVQIEIDQASNAYAIKNVNFIDSCLPVFPGDCGTTMPYSSTFLGQPFSISGLTGGSFAAIRIKSPASFGENVYMNGVSSVSFDLVSSKIGSSANPDRKITINQSPFSITVSD